MERPDWQGKGGGGGVGRLPYAARQQCWAQTGGLSDTSLLVRSNRRSAKDSDAWMRKEYSVISETFVT